MLTGYGNIPTAVAAIKEGAIDYLAKPADADDVEKALLADPTKKAAPPENPMSADRVKWEHIHRVFELGVMPFLLAEFFKISLILILAKKILKLRQFI